MLNKFKLSKYFQIGIFSLIFVILLVLQKKAYAQQDVQFSQYVFTGMALNPAYAGYKEETNLHILYRDQWTGLTGAPKTITASMDGVSEDGKIGLGGEITQDALGAQSSLAALGVFAYRLTLNEHAKLSFGLAAGVDQYLIDGSKLFTTDQGDAIGSLQKNLIQPDLQFGAFLATQKYFLAFSACDLFATFRQGDPAYLVIYRNRHYYLQGGGLFNLGSDLKLKPSVIFKEDFLGPTNIDLNVFLLISNKLWLGTSYRTGVTIFNKAYLQKNLISNDAYSILAEFFVTDRFRIGYSFDYTTNRLRDVNNGTHEISIGYTLRNNRPPMLSPRYF